MAQGTCLSSIGRRWRLEDVLQLLQLADVLQLLQLADVLQLLQLGILLRHMLRRQVQSLHDKLAYADVR
jgi:hypothetical protein